MLLILVIKPNFQIEKMMQKLVAIVLITGLAAGCATTSSMSTKNNVSVAKVNLNSVSVNLKQKYDNPVFYSQADIEQYLNKCLITELSKKGKYQANSSANLNVNVDYKRVYSGEAFGMKSSVGSPQLNYNYQVTDNNTILQQNSENDLIVNSGLIGNFNYTGNTEKKDENGYIDALCRHIAKKVY